MRLSMRLRGPFRPPRSLTCRLMMAGCSDLSFAAARPCMRKRSYSRLLPSRIGVQRNERGWSNPMEPSALCMRKNRRKSVAFLSISVWARFSGCVSILTFYRSLFCLFHLIERKRKKYPDSQFLELRISPQHTPDCF